MIFDKEIDRSGTWSLKWDDPYNDSRDKGIIPLWVADMDFSPPDSVIKAITRRAEHPLYGYTRLPKEYPSLLAGWQKQRLGFDIGEECFIAIPAVMPGIAMAIGALTRPGEGIIITPPVYYPFFDVVRDNGRTLIEAPLAKAADGSLALDLEGMRKAMREAAAEGCRSRALLLSNPHNPGGRAWTEEELRGIVGLCEEEDLLILSDEIHQDIVFAPRRHLSLLDPLFGAAAARRVVSFSGPNKTFNLAGLHIAHAAVRDPGLRDKMRGAVKAFGFSQPNAFSITAAMEAYASGGPWLDELLGYLAENRNFAAEGIQEVLPGAKAISPEATYLLWVDLGAPIGELGVGGDRELIDLLAREARTRLSAGSVFGRGGEGHARLNFACPRSLLSAGLDRIGSWYRAKKRGS